MKFLVIAFAVAAVVSGLPHKQKNEGRIIMTFADDGKTPIYENLDDPVPVGLDVDIAEVRFLLYTRDNRVDFQELKPNDANGLKKSNFDAKNPTVFLVHGWQNSHQSESVQIVKDSYLQIGDVNVILFDYEKYNSPYTTAVNNAEDLGGCLATFVNYLVLHGLKPKELHLIGHSLGSHICGYAANKIIGNVDRITGLDPAGPLFNNNKPEKRLSDDDATIVDVIHTSNSLGMTDVIGTHDFYPHGGHTQPQCADNTLADGCDHSESYRYFSETIKNRQLFPAKKCKTQKEAQIADPATNPCTTSTAYMGESGSEAAKGIYYVNVN